MRDANNYVLEHRLVMAESLGRSLTPSEIVHHIDGDKTNNCITNLGLTTRQEHMSLHITWNKSPRECPTCGVSFTPARKPRGVRSYCSRECGGISKKKC